MAKLAKVFKVFRKTIPRCALQQENSVDYLIIFPALQLLYQPPLFTKNKQK